MHVLVGIGRIYGFVGWAERPTRGHFRSIAVWLMTAAVALGVVLVGVGLEGHTVPVIWIGVAIGLFVAGAAIGLLTFTERRHTVRPAALPAPAVPPSLPVPPRTQRDRTPREVVDALNLRSGLPVRLAAPLDLAGEVEAAWVRKQPAVLVCMDAMNPDEKRTAPLELLCILWQSSLATWVSEYDLSRLAKIVYPCIPKVHSGLWTRTETENCAERFVKGALRRLALRNLLEESRHAQHETRISPLDGVESMTADTSFSEYRWTKLGRAMASLLTETKP